MEWDWKGVMGKADVDKVIFMVDVMLSYRSLLPGTANMSFSILLNISLDVCINILCSFSI